MLKLFKYIMQVFLLVCFCSYYGGAKESALSVCERLRNSILTSKGSLSDRCFLYNLLENRRFHRLYEHLKVGGHLRYKQEKLDASYFLVKNDHEVTVFEIIKKIFEGKLENTVVGPIYRVENESITFFRFVVETTIPEYELRDLLKKGVLSCSEEVLAIGNFCIPVTKDEEGRTIKREYLPTNRVKIIISVWGKEPIILTIFPISPVTVVRHQMVPLISLSKSEAASKDSAAATPGNKFPWDTSGIHNNKSSRLSRFKKVSSFPFEAVKESPCVSPSSEGSPHCFAPRDEEEHTSNSAAASKGSSAAIPGNKFLRDTSGTHSKKNASIERFKDESSDSSAHSFGDSDSLGSSPKADNEPPTKKHKKDIETTQEHEKFSSKGEN